MSRSDMEAYVRSLMESSYGGTIDPDTPKASNDLPPSPPPPISVSNNKSNNKNNNNRRRNNNNNNNNNNKTNNNNDNDNEISTAHQVAVTAFCGITNATIENAVFYLSAQNYDLEAAVNMYIEMAPADSINSNSHDDPPEPPIRQPLASIPRYNMEENDRVPLRNFHNSYGQDDDDDYGIIGGDGFIRSPRAPKADKFDAEGIRLPDDVVKRRLLNEGGRGNYDEEIFEREEEDDGKWSPNCEPPKTLTFPGYCYHHYHCCY